VLDEVIGGVSPHAALAVAPVDAERLPMDAGHRPVESKDDEQVALQRRLKQHAPAANRDAPRQAAPARTDAADRRPLIWSGVIL